MTTTIPSALPPPASPGRRAVQAIRQIVLRVRHGRPGILALRALAALALAVAVVHSGAGPAPISGTLAGVATWLALTARGDLAPPPDGDQ